MSKIETTSKVSLKLASRINLGRQGMRAELSTLDTAHKPPPPPTPATHTHTHTKSVERVKKKQDKFKNVLF